MMIVMLNILSFAVFFFFFQAEDGIRDYKVTGVQTCALPIFTPGETRKITLRYTQVLDRVGDAVRFRYAAGTAAVSRSFRLQVDSAAGVGDPYSPTHRLTVSRSGDRLELALADTTAGGDLELLLPLARGLVGMV